MSDIAKAYESGEISGWLESSRPGIARAAFSLLKDYFTPFKIVGQTQETKGQKMFLHDVTRAAMDCGVWAVPDYYKQEIGDPFVAGTKVLMADGSEKNIEDIEIGEQVVNHKNELARVTNVIKKKFTGNLVTIKAKGWHRKLTATETHHGMVLPFKTHRFKYNGCERMKFGQMNVGDYVLLPFGREEVKKQVVDLAELADWESVDDNYCYAVSTRVNRAVNRFITVDSNFARFVGLFLAEGSSSKQGISFSLNAKEEVYMQEIIALGKELFGLDGVIWKTGVESCRRVAFNCRHLGKVFSKLVGKHSHSKFVPNMFFNASKLTKIALIRGWMDGDGHKKFHTNTVIGYTSSEQLGDDIARLSMSCGINAHTSRRSRKKRSKVPTTEIHLFSTESYKVYPEQVTLATKVKKITQNNTPYGYARPIESIAYEAVVDHEVYCITTENEWSAIFNGIASYQCVSFGAKHGTTICSMVEIFKNGEAEKWRPVHPSYYYGTGRLYEGNMGGYEDGSVGSWMAAAVMKWGTLFADEPGVPKYSGQVAKQFGANRQSIDKWKPTAMPFPMKSATQINSWDELVAAIVNGYPCPTASSIGYSMEPGRDGFHAQTTSWNHQMCFIGVDDGYKNGEEPYALILNNWDDCFSSDTEVLTKRGWQLFSELEPDEEFATLNTESWKLEYQQSTERQRKFVNDGMVSITGRDIDMLVTPNHRVYMCSYSDDKQNSDNWGCVTAQSLPKHFYVKKDAEWDGEEIKDIEIAGKTIDADTWFEFMGYFLAEGCSSESYRTNYSESKANIGLKVACAKKQRVYTVGISQNEPSANIESCLIKLPFTFSKWQSSSKAWSCRNQKLGAYLKQFGKSYEKFVPDYIKNGSKRQIQLFFDAMMFGDGTTGNGAFVYYTSSRRLADDMQELALKIGFAADIVSIDRVGKETCRGGTTRHIEYRVGIKRQQLMQHVTHESVIVPYEDFVNCVTVPNGTLYVRRNGKASWCGNCHGHLKDFDNGSDLPYGILRVRRRDAEKHIRAGETYAYSQFQGMPEQRLDRSKFKFL